MFSDDVHDLAGLSISPESIASGVLMSRLSCDAGEAMGRLEVHAMRTGQPLSEIARDVIRAAEAGTRN